MRAALILVVALMLSSCGTKPPATPEPVVISHDVPVVIPISCTKKVSDLGPTPAYPDTDDALAAVPDIFTAVKLYKAGRVQRIARENLLTSALSACAGEMVPVNK